MVKAVSNFTPIEHSKVELQLNQHNLYLYTYTPKSTET